MLSTLFTEIKKEIKGELKKGNTVRKKDIKMHRTGR